MDLVKAKLARPALPGDLVSRTRLTRAVAAAGRRAVMLEAPAGYGKTTLMAQIPLSRGEIALWYRLDPTDNAFRQFLTYLASAMEGYFPGTDAAVSDLLSAPPDHLRADTAAGRFLDILSGASGRVTLFLDDVHLLEDGSARAFLLHLARYADRKIRMVFASDTPAPDLENLPPARQPLILTERDLRFSEEETEDYLDAEQEATAVASLRGWILGLSLLKRHGWSGLREEMDRWAEALLSGERREVQELLTVVAHFPDATPALCDAVLSAGPEQHTVPASEPALRELVLRGGSGLTESGGRYSLHPAIAQALRKQRPLHGKQAAAALECLVGEGQYARALGISLEHGDAASATRILRESRYAPLSLTGADRVRYYLSLLLPAGLETQSAPLRLLAAAGLLNRPDDTAAEAECGRLLKTARQEFGRDSDTEGLLFAGLLEAALLRRTGRPDQAARQLRDLMEPAATHPVGQVDLVAELAALAAENPEHTHPFRAWRDTLYPTLRDRAKNPLSARLLYHISLWYLRDGQPRRAWALHELLVTWFGAYRPPAELLLWRCRTGRFEEAAEWLEAGLHQDIQEDTEELLPAPPDRSLYLLGRGICLRREHRFDAADPMLRRAEARAGKSGDAETAFLCRLEHIRTQTLQGAADALAAAEAFCRDTGERAEAVAMLASACLLTGQKDRAGSLAERVLTLPRTGICRDMDLARMEAVLVLAGARTGDLSAEQKIWAALPPALREQAALWREEYAGVCPEGLGPVSAASPAPPARPDTLQIRFFGDMRVESGGVPIRWRTYRARDLFFLLALHRGVKVRRTVLVNNLFPDASPEQLAHQVKNTLSLLRRGLDRAGFDGMVMAMAGEYWLDADRLDGDYYELVRLLHDLESRDGEERTRMVRRACALHDGELCGALDFPFLVRLRRSLRTQLTAALLREIEVLVAQRHLTTALELADALCRIEPEENTYQSIRHALAGRAGRKRSRTTGGG